MVTLDDGIPCFLKVPGHEESEIALCVDDAMTGLDVIRWEQIRGEAPPHESRGNRLLSVQDRMIAPHELVRPALPESWSGCVTLADYSQLIPAEGKICRIRATELRGIRVAQLHSLLVFIKEMAPYWCETFGAEAGQALLFEKFNLYNANQWIIRPSAEGRGGHRIHLSKVMSQVEKGCSYVELVSMEAEAQRPHWFVSHAWKEPIVNFVSCLEKHLAVRGLSPESPYWVCAYANNQHTLDKEITEDPRETAFYRAMKASEGVLLILDKDATPFSRIWCCFEESVAVERSVGSREKLLQQP